MFRCYAVLVAYRLFIVEHSLGEGASRFGVEHLDPVRYQLHGVGIAGDDNGIGVFTGGLLAEAAEDIVGLVAVKLKNGQIESFNQLPYPPQLTHQFLRGSRPVSLVLFIKLMTEGGPLFIKGYRPVTWFQLANCFEQHAGKAIDGTHHFSALADSKRWQNMVGPVKKGIAVYKQQQFLHGVIIADGQLGKKDSRVTGLHRLACCLLQQWQPGCLPGFDAAQHIEDFLEVQHCHQAGRGTTAAATFAVDQI